MQIHNISKSVVKSSGKFIQSLPYSKPQKTPNINGLKYISLQKDICEFSADYSLCPVFVKKLLADLDNFGSDNLKKIYYLRNKFMKAMGYKSSPDLLKIKPYSFDLDIYLAGFNFQENAIFYSKQMLKEDNRYLIANIRHELDHFDKYAKLVACEGYDKVYNAMIKQILKSFTDITVDVDKKTGRININISKPVVPNKYKEENEKFWNIFSKEANINEFNPKEYMRSFNRDIHYKTLKLDPLEHICTFYLYCTNPFEVSAYEYTKKMYDILGIKEKTIYELFTKPIEKLLYFLNRNNIKNETFNKLYAKRAVLDIENGKEIIESGDFDNVCELFNKTPIIIEKIPKYIEDVCTWIKNGKVDLNINQT